MRERHPTHGYDHSFGATGESKNEFKFSVSPDATKSTGKPKGASAGGLKVTEPKKKGRKGKGGAVAGTSHAEPKKPEASPTEGH